MTNEEALRVLHCPSAYLTDEDSELARTIPMFSKAYGQAMAVAFEALKQADTLDKIRAEIEQKCCITVGQENEPAITLYDVFQIIDKYKAESEENNGNG